MVLRVYLPLSCWICIYLDCDIACYNPDEIDKTVCSRCSGKQIINLRICLFFIDKNSFRHLNLELVLAIPASNEGNIETNNSVGQGL